MFRYASILSAVVLWGSGCASRQPAPPPPRPQTVFLIEPGGYAQAFNAVRDTFRAQGFTLNRVDAREGIITTLPAPAADLKIVASSFGDYLNRSGESLLHRHRRKAEARFLAPDIPQSGDLRQWPGELRLQLTVSVERLHRFDTQIEPVSIRLSSVSAFERSGQPAPSIAVSYLEEDEYLASLLLTRVKNSLVTSEK